MSSRRRVSLLILSEDGSDGAFDTICWFVKHILLSLDECTQTHLIDFEPSTSEAQVALSGNRWKEGRGPHYTTLLGAIAGKLVEDDGFVFFHFDGDTVWESRNLCLTREQFEADVVAKLPPFIRMRLEQRNAEAQRKGKPTVSSEYIDDVIARAMPRLFAVVPHYSIEAWCYQSTRKARELCERHHGGRHANVFDAWASDRGAIDEVDKPKEQCCLHDKHNATLAAADFPRREVVATGKSFAQCVSDCDREPLRSALAMTYAWSLPDRSC